MLLRNLYYTLKPILPWSLRMGIRRFFAKRKLEKVKDVWPINEVAGEKPEGWRGWPDGKQFAFVLTHDVESQKGLDNVRKLAELEMELGFRSSFNLIPEGEYTVPKELRDWLTDNGFEIGVHDLHHDGKLFNSREEFAENAKHINRYAKEWEAVGFRSGFMLRNLEWIDKLEIDYDASTFDTDPFEHQPKGAGTIFPYWIKSRISKRKFQYLELPYTLPQDSTLFLLFNDKKVDVWKKKTDWIAKNGGMVLLNSHPDYTGFSSNPGKSEFPVLIYKDFLNYIRSEYSGRYWHSNPKQLAQLAKNGNLAFDTMTTTDCSTAVSTNDTTVAKIWIDLENTPHIPFFSPIIEELKKRNYQIALTARDAYQTCEMADLHKFNYNKIGRHYGKHKLMKFYGLFARSAQLLPFTLKNKPTLSLNHGSRTQTLVSNILGIPTVCMMDYEHTSSLPFIQAKWMLSPEVVAGNFVDNNNLGSVLGYSGIKEDVYVPDFTPDPSIIEELGLDHAKLIVTVRPPATEAHYHNAESEILFSEFMNRIIQVEGSKTIVLPRNNRQKDQIRHDNPEWFETDRVLFPEKVVNGLNLLWHSDLVVSGGGTMNREAAALGLAVYSIFRGTIGAVDKQLSKEGRLVLIESPDDIHSKIKLEPRKRNLSYHPKRKTLYEIVDHIEAIISDHALSQS